MEQFHRDAVAAWKKTPDAIETLVANCIRMHSEKATLQAELAAARAQAETAEAECLPRRGVASEASLNAANRVMAAHIRVVHNHLHGLEWIECDAPMCEDARAALDGAAAQTESSDGG